MGRENRKTMQYRQQADAALDTLCDEAEQNRGDGDTAEHLGAGAVEIAEIGRAHV